MERIIREYKIDEEYSWNYIFNNNLELLKLYSVDDFQCSIQNHIFGIKSCNIIFSMSPSYILSLNLSNAYEFFIYIKQVKSLEFEYIRDIFLDVTRKIELTPDLFYRWLYKNDDFIHSVFYSNLENFNRLTEYFIIYEPEYHNNYIKEIFDEEKIKFWYGINLESSGNIDNCNIDNCNIDSTDYIDDINTFYRYCKENFHKFYVKKIDFNEFEIISDDNERYTFGILDAYTFYLSEKIGNLRKGLYSGKINFLTFQLEYLRKFYFEYKNKYNYKLYVVNRLLHKDIKYIPEGTKIIAYNFREESIPIEHDLSEYIDVLNYMISLETKISIDDFYNRFGNRGFEIFNYKLDYNIFVYSDPDNNLWYHFYKVIVEDSNKNAILNKLTNIKKT